MLSQHSTGIAGPVLSTSTPSKMAGPHLDDSWLFEDDPLRRTAKALDRHISGSENARGRSTAPAQRRRDSSASSVRSLVDDRMRMADEERSRSRAASPAAPSSPFRSGSPYEHEYRRASQGEGQKSFYGSPDCGLQGAVLIRSSGAGPCRCTRINPATNKPCNTVFSRPYDLTKHENTIHDNRKRKIKCPLCREEKTFSRNDALYRHMRVVHPEVESYGKRSGYGNDSTDFTSSSFAEHMAHPDSVSAPKHDSDIYVSPHRKLVTERLQTANLAQSASATSAVSREKSAFKDGSPLAPPNAWKVIGQVRTATGIRQQQREEAEQVEYSQGEPLIEQESIKSISPKEAILGYNDIKRLPLFLGQVSSGYRTTQTYAPHYGLANQSPELYRFESLYRRNTENWREYDQQHLQPGPEDSHHPETRMTPSKEKSADETPVTEAHRGTELGSSSTRHYSNDFSYVNVAMRTPSPSLPYMGPVAPSAPGPWNKSAKFGKDSNHSDTSARWDNNSLPSPPGTEPKVSYIVDNTGNRITPGKHQIDRSRPPSSPTRSLSTSKRRSSREPPPRTYICSVCGYSFSRRVLRDNHERTHTNERPFVCSFQGCDEAFKTKNDQTRHENTIHRSKRFVCGGVLSCGSAWGCGKRFARSDGLLEHHTKTSKGRSCMASRDCG